MKRVIPILCMLLFSIFLPSSVRTARAEEARYAAAAQTDTWFYTQADGGAGLFVLPYTYCVRVIEEGSEFCRVEYGGADGLPLKEGYCRTEQLKILDFAPEHPFLSKRVTLTYTLSNPAPVGGGQTEIEREAQFLGFYTAGTSRYWYVFLDGEFFYVAETEPVDFPLNMGYLEPDPENGGGANENAGTGLPAVYIVVICLLCAVAVAIAVFVVRGKKPTRAPADERAEF